jgi:hypothetical protein
MDIKQLIIGYIKSQKLDKYFYTLNDINNYVQSLSKEQLRKMIREKKLI